MLHPDLVLDEDEKARRHDLMAKANIAYQEGDEELLAKMLDEQQNSPDAVRGDGVGAELIRLIRRIAQAEGRLREIDSEFDALKDSELFELKLKVEEAEPDGRDLLSEMANQVMDQITNAREILDDEVQTRLRNG